MDRLIDFSSNMGLGGRNPIAVSIYATPSALQQVENFQALYCERGGDLSERVDREEAEVCVAERGVRCAVSFQDLQ
jgi:hypothetical protein